MRYTAEYLYGLLPEVYRVRDSENGGALAALLAVIAEQADLIEDNITELYDNWFVETAQDWAIPYIADLIALRNLNPIAAGEVAVVSQRGLAANTLRYRRRKGTLAVIEGLARDVTGWPARAVEYMQLLATTQSLNHTRPHNPYSPDLHDVDALDRLDGPFETTPRTAEVRLISSSRGRYNIPNVGVHLFRLQAYPLGGVSAARVDSRRFRFNPLGIDMPLFNNPEDLPDGLVGPEHVPMPLTRRRLRGRLASLYGAGKSLAVRVDGVVRGNIHVCNLADDPAAPGQWAHAAAPGEIAVDPVLGRLVFGDVPGGEVTTDHTYGFSGDVGGGPYDRNASVKAQVNRPEVWAVDWRADVILGQPQVDDQNYPSLQDAIDAWNALPAGREGVIVLPDSRTYALSGVNPIEVKAGSRLLLVAGTWPDGFAYGQVDFTGRKFDQLRAAQVRPLVLDSLRVAGTAATNELAGTLALNGIVFASPVTVQAGRLGLLELAHCTLVPGRSGLNTEANPKLQVIFERCICGPLALEASAEKLTLVESIVQADALPASQAALQAQGAAAGISGCTIIGETAARTLEAENSLFTGKVVAARRQVGCMRFCGLGDFLGSRTPRRFRCQPDLALSARLDELAPLAELPPDEEIAVARRLEPRFTTLRYGAPAYTQLSRACPEGIRRGGEDRSEMGVWFHLKGPQREDNLRVALAEYVRAGLETGAFFAT